jgi:hypothetical protein
MLEQQREALRQTPCLGAARRYPSAQSQDVCLSKGFSLHHRTVEEMRIQHAPPHPSPRPRAPSFNSPLLRKSMLAQELRVEERRNKDAGNGGQEGGREKLQCPQPSMQRKLCVESSPPLTQSCSEASKGSESRNKLAAQVLLHELLREEAHLSLLRALILRCS